MKANARSAYMIKFGDLSGVNLADESPCRRFGLPHALAELRLAKKNVRPGIPSKSELRERPLTRQQELFQLVSYNGGASAQDSLVRTVYRLNHPG